MNAPVDVLAVLDGIIETGELFGNEHALPFDSMPGNVALREARAAVAELVEAAKLARDGLDVAASRESPEFPAFVLAADRLRAALARVRGGK